VTATVYFRSTADAVTAKNQLHGLSQVTLNAETVTLATPLDVSFLPVKLPTPKNEKVSVGHLVSAPVAPPAPPALPAAFAPRPTPPASVLPALLGPGACVQYIPLPPSPVVAPPPPQVWPWPQVLPTMPGMSPAYGVALPFPYAHLPTVSVNPYAMLPPPGCPVGQAQFHGGIHVVPGVLPLL